MNTRTALTIIVALLLVHLAALALFAYVLTHARAPISFPVAPRVTAAPAPALRSQLSALDFAWGQPQPAGRADTLGARRIFPAPGRASGRGFRAVDSGLMPEAGGLSAAPVSFGFTGLGGISMPTGPAKRACVGLQAPCKLVGGLTRPENPAPAATA